MNELVERLKDAVENAMKITCSSGLKRFCINEDEDLQAAIDLIESQAAEIESLNQALMQRAGQSYVELRAKCAEYDKAMGVIAERIEILGDKYNNMPVKAAGQGIAMERERIRGKDDG